MFIPGTLLAVLALDASAAAHPPAVRVNLALDAQLTAPVRAAAIEEADSIWRPYGVMVTAADGSAPTLTVIVAAVPDGPPDPSGPFASIRFTGGDPQPIVNLYLDRLSTVGLSCVRVGGVGADRWPPAMRNRVVGRMAGRALAHEIGHWLLRTKTHSASGLMRAVQPATQMAEAARIHFRLGVEDVARLQLQRALAENRTEFRSGTNG